MSVINIRQRNSSWLDNQTIEFELLIEAGASEPNPEARHKIYDEMQRLILEDAPSVFLYVPQEIEASSATVHNWEPSPDSRINLHDVWLSG